VPHQYQDSSPLLPNKSCALVLPVNDMFFHRQIDKVSYLSVFYVQSGMPTTLCLACSMFVLGHLFMDDRP
jgi:hypothetical protein